MYVPLEIPPGVFRNGTKYQSKGRWYDANLVRWENGEMKPIGGWQQYGSAQLRGRARGMLSWRDNNIGVWGAVGTVGANVGGTAVSGGSTFIELDSNASTTQDAYLQNLIKITSGTGAGQVRRIIAYSSSRLASVATAWDTTPDNTSVYRIYGTSILVFGSTGDFYDVTPTELQPQSEDASALGYGFGAYGRGTYGTPRSNDSTLNFAPTWSMDTWGQYLIGCLSSDGRIYEWQLDVLTNAAPLANAPTANTGVLTTQERFVFALGADGNSRQIRWCDQGDNTTWAPASTNQAGNKIIESGGPIMQGVKTRGSVLIFTTTDIYQATYLGAPLVYGFDRVGSSNGIVSRRAAVAADTFVAWMGPRGFWVFDGYVREIPCEVEDYVFSDFNYDEETKVHGWINSQYNEIWWHYPSSGSTECDRYVVWNYSENHWNIGSIDQLETIDAAVDRGVLRYPMMSWSDGKIYEHEVVGRTHGTRRPVNRPFARSGPMDVGDGKSAYALRMIPDEKTVGDVRVELISQQWPNGPERRHGPYSTRSPTDLRINARMMSLRVEEASVGDWRWGKPQLYIKPGGLR